MKCNIKWGSQYIAPQNFGFEALLQDPRYGKAIEMTTRLTPLYGAIIINDTQAGWVQMHEIKKLGGLIHGLTLDRGPVWAAGFGGAHHIKAFFDELNRQFPRRWGRNRRIIPEIIDSPVARKMLESAGLERVGEGYQTFVMDLTRSIDDLRANLAQKWRNILNKAEKNEQITLDWDEKARQMPWFLKVYEQNKRKKQYSGPSPQFLNHLAQLMSPDGDIIMGRAIMDGSAISSVLIACHGGCATYLAGWTGEKGRDTGAHYRLLWDALSVLQQKGITKFDLGGFNDDSASTIRHFKEGMGGALYTLAGRYR